MDMKKIMIIGVALLAVVMVAAYFFRIKPSELPQEVANNNHDPIVLYVESGEVSYKEPDQNTFIIATGSVKIPSMTIVETKIGRASVLMPDNSTISLEDNTQITVDYAPTKISIFQAFGTTYHRVEKLLGGASYQVQTPETLAAVRGTKFAVKYDKVTKKTKVSVTESIVEVAALNKPKNGTTTEEIKESRMVNEGEMAVVTGITATTTTSTMKVAISVLKTDSDTEMRATVAKEKAKDVILEDIKKNFKDKADVRDEIQKQFFKDEDREGKNDNKNRDDRDEEDDDTTSVRTDTEIKSDSNSKNEDERKNLEKKAEEKRVAEKKDETTTTLKKTARDDVVEIKKTDEEQATQNDDSDDGDQLGVQRTTITTPIKMGEEEYFTKFESMFISYFYIENDETFCAVKLSPEEKVSQVTTFAKTSGYPISRNLLPFAKALSEFCLKKDDSLRKALQARFDEEYPYQ